jgi:hypothetical protein
MLTAPVRLQCDCNLVWGCAGSAGDCCGLLELLTLPELQAVLAHGRCNDVCAVSCCVLRKGHWMQTLALCKDPLLFSATHAGA